MIKKVSVFVSLLLFLSAHSAKAELPVKIPSPQNAVRQMMPEDADIQPISCVPSNSGNEIECSVSINVDNYERVWTKKDQSALEELWITSQGLDIKIQDTNIPSKYDDMVSSCERMALGAKLGQNKSMYIRVSYSSSVSIDDLKKGMQNGPRKRWRIYLGSGDLNKLSCGLQ